MKQHLIDLESLNFSYQVFYDYSENNDDFALVIPVFKGSTDDVMIGYAKSATYSALSFIKNTDFVLKHIPVYIAIEECYSGLLEPYLESVPESNRIYFSKPRNYSDDIWQNGCLSMKLAPIFHDKLKRFQKVIVSDAENFVINPNVDTETGFSDLPVADIINHFKNTDYRVGTYTFTGDIRFLYNHLINKLAAAGIDPEIFYSRIGSAFNFQGHESAGITMGFTILDLHKDDEFKAFCDNTIGLINDEILLEIYIKHKELSLLNLKEVLPISVYSDMCIDTKMIYHATGYEILTKPELKEWYDKEVSKVVS